MRDVTLAKLMLEMRYTQMSVTALMLHRRENYGSQYLSKKFPHILAELEDLTLDWTLVPKVVVSSPKMLTTQVKTYRENLSMALPDLPPQVTPIQYRKMMEKILSYLENKVLPILEKMPPKSNKPADINEDEDYQKVVNILGLTQSPEQENIQRDTEGAH